MTNICKGSIIFIYNSSGGDLDEVFAYYDDERLKNILNYISEEFENSQIIIFTCTNREQNSFDKLNIDYKLISL